MSIQELLAETARLDASDLHIIAGFPPMLRISDQLHPVSGTTVLSPSQTEEYILALCTPERKELFLANKELDFSISTPQGRFRANIYHQKGTVAGAFRHIPSTIRTIEALGLPNILYEF
ncbi:type IV pili twitching motility protein PilT, partial [Patescibacteria group bacterium]|nr:type IV pili twitching motility protein PilT [Patescibacteria group bacterium]